MIDDDYETYHRLPSYDYMCDCWWIWDVKKFIDKKDPKADAAIERWSDLAIATTQRLSVEAI